MDINTRIKETYIKFKEKFHSSNPYKLVRVFVWCDVRGIKWTVGDSDTEHTFDTLDELENFVDNYKANTLIYKDFSDIRDTLKK